ncbi:MAG: tyrS [Candidatus Saccharibacteria bacterium]|nr:tyrS [Candidatus Saccharibacteria bacterium]
MANMTLSEELQWRGFLNQTTLRDITELDTKQRIFYMGFDASADSQAIGNLAGMMFARTFLRHGYKGVMLAGGSTSLIGDPGGKDAERPLQDEETIARNVKNAEAQLQKILTGHDFKLVNNLDWTKDLSVVAFLRDIGKHFSMTPLIQRDYIANRLGEGGGGISYAEFSYTILQGMDYLHLYDTENVTLQLGGSDQWGNCLSGVDLIRRARGVAVDVITLNLVINKATGKKFGKSEEGAVWLDPNKTTPTQFYQFWINVDDQGVEEYLKIYTELTKDEIDEIMTRHTQDERARFAQTRLAQEVTRLTHGQKEMDIAEEVTTYLTAKASIADANPESLTALRKEIPSVRARSGDDLLDILVATELANSKSDARRLLEGNAIAINGQKTTKGNLEESDFQNGRLLIRKGKAFKDSALVEQA